MTIVHLCAKNDLNGNPQRLYALTDEAGLILASWDEGYRGHHAVPGPWRDAAYNAERQPISVSSYRRVLANTPHPDWAHDVPGYEHLRTLAEV
jgi:hypothetical protein